MTRADELVSEVKRKKKTDEEWLKLKKDILEFLNANPSQEDKKKFVPLGYLEVVTMVCDGIERKRL